MIAGLMDTINMGLYIICGIIIGVFLSRFIDAFKAPIEAAGEQNKKSRFYSAAT